MNRFHAYALPFAFAAGLTATSAVATTSISGEVAVGTRSTLGTIIDTHSDGSSAVAPAVTSLSAATSSSAVDGAATNLTNATVNATWSSANSGTIGLTWGWNINAPSYGAQTTAETNLAYPSNWKYTFTASGNGTFSGRYNVTGTGDTFGLQPLYTTLDWTSGTLGGTVSDPNGSGTFSVALLAGNTYTMSIAQYGNISGEAGLLSNGSATGSVDWAISYAGVPEPAMWGMMIGGFGVTGFAARRRRSGQRTVTA